MKLFSLFLLFSVMIAGASADVQTSNTYYTQGSTVYDSVILKDNAQFASVVGIDCESIVGKAVGTPVTGEEESSFAAIISIYSKGLSFGAQTDVQAEDASWGKEWTAGKTNVFKLSYSLGTGAAEAKGYRTGSMFEEYLVLDESNYIDKITGTDEQITLNGKGARISTEDANSMFEHKLKITKDDKWAMIVSEANCVKDVDRESVPTIYVWDADAYASDKVDTSGMEILAVAGDRPLDLSLKGTCSVPGLLKEGEVKLEKHISPLPFELEDPDISDLIDLLDADFTCKMEGHFVILGSGEMIS